MQSSAAHTAKSLKISLHLDPEAGIDYQSKKVDRIILVSGMGKSSSGLYGNNQQSSGNLMKNDKLVSDSKNGEQET